MKRIAYGESNFASIIQEGSFFIDKTPFLPLLEQAGKNLVFLRPRRFGKSLCISMMQYYYGLEHKGKFADLFGHLGIGQNPTAEANNQLVLKFDFSGISTESAQSTKASFLHKIHGVIQVFLHRYQAYFPIKSHKEILKNREPADLLHQLFNHWALRPGAPQIYILIDEYDHFANELIAFRVSDFKNIVSKNGFVHKFYETIKIGTQEGAVGRVFITGVSPITLDSLTSGFNITTSLTIDPQFHALMGFTTDETAETLRNVGATDENLPPLLNDLKRWYDGYRFHPSAAENLFNSDMVLYFARHFARLGQYPDDMLDINIASDFGKIRETFRIAGREMINQVVLDEVLLKGETNVSLTRQFSFEVEFDADNFKSLLFYMGHLTIEGAMGGQWLLKIPNQVIRELYWKYYGSLTREQTGLAIHTDDVKYALNDLILRNNPQPLVALVAKTLDALSNRDNQNFDEKHLKAIMASFLVLSNSYLMRSEFETKRQYVDLLLLKRPPFSMPHQFAFELKYLKQDAPQSLIETKEQEAEAQIRTYMASAELAALEDLRAWVVVAGKEVKVLRQVEDSGA